MNEIDRQVIKIYFDELVNETIFSDILRELVEHDNIITSNLKKKYKDLQENGETNHTLNHELYKDIQTRGKTAFKILIQCLLKVHPHLAELLLPNERVPEPAPYAQETYDQYETDLTEYQGICTLKVNQREKSALMQAVKKLCHSIKAQLVTDDQFLTEANFHLGIKVGKKFEEEDIKNIENLYNNPSNLKIIMINIISEEIDNAVVNPITTAKGSTGYNPAAVFIVNIHIHEGDHLPSVINIIKEVVSHNPGYEIRDIFRVVMGKLAKWGCRLNSESRSFPKFYF